MSISVVINTCDAEEHLATVLSHLKGFDEIVVCDMQSTDRTREIAAEAGCRVITHERLPYKEPARDFAIRRASNDWVLVLDPDEIVTAGLERYLRKFTADCGDICGLYIPRKNYFMNRFRRATYPDYKLRFFRKSVTSWPHDIHSTPKVKGKLRKIPANRQDLALIHIPADMEGAIERINRYSTVEAAESRGTRVTLPGLLIKPFLVFFNAYIMHGGFSYGLPGFAAATNRAFHLYARMAKIYEANAMDKFDLREEEKFPEVDEKL